jgi:hypothetical protein
MTVHTVRTHDRDSLARFLGWFGVVLGLAQIVAPRALCRIVARAPRERPRT